MKVLVFTSPSCKPCGTLKNYVELNSLNVEYIDVTTEEGSAQAQQYRVRSLPTVVAVDNTGVRSTAVGFNGDTRALLVQFGK